MGSSLAKLAQRKTSGPSANRKKWIENQHLLSPSIFKLNGHCFDELFEYLSLADLDSLGQTCELMQQMTAKFFTRNYSAAKFTCLRDGTYMLEIDGYDGHVGHYAKVEIDKCIPIRGFIPLITWIAIENNIVTGQWNDREYCMHQNFSLDMGKFKYFEMHSDEFKSVKKISLTNVRLNRRTVSCILKILPNIEVLELTYCTVTQDFYDILLKYCKTVRRIQLFYVRFKNQNEYKWLLRSYEKLEHLQLNVRTLYHFNHDDKINELRTFFELNPTVRSFACYAWTLRRNIDALLDSNVELETIEVMDLVEWNYWKDGVPWWDVLCDLQNHGVYKHLHLHLANMIWHGHPETTFWGKKAFVALNGPLNRFHLIEYSVTGTYIQPYDKYKNAILEENFMNVERLCLFRDTYDISLFIKTLRNLKTLKLFKFKTAEVLQLNKWNEEREKLAGAKKVSIYVPDAVYLATKWATKNGTTNFSLIEMKRTESYEWNRSCFLSVNPFHSLQLPPGMV